MLISEVGTAHPYHRFDAVLEELSMMFYRSGNASKWLVLPVTWHVLPLSSPSLVYTTEMPADTPK